jgi:PAS domain S-box-containing protein
MPRRQQQKSGRAPPSPAAHRVRGTATTAVQGTGGRTRLRYGEVLQRAVSNYAPAAVLIDPGFEILSMQGPLVDYLEFPAGQPTRNLLALARPGLRARIRALVHRALAESAAVTDDAAHVRRNGRHVRCLLSARRLSEPREVRGSLLIVFQDRDASRDAVIAAHESPLLAQLEEELKATREDLQRSIEECAGVNAELRASNSEVQSQSAQLRAASEQLQSSLAYRRAIEHLPVAAIICGKSPLCMNQAAETLTGYRQGDLPTLDAFVAALFGDHQGTVLEHIAERRRRAGCEPLTASLTRKDGSERAVELSGSFAAGIDVITLRDVTEKRALRATCWTSPARSNDVSGRSCTTSCCRI